MKYTFTFWGEDENGVAHTEVIEQSFNAIPKAPCAPDGTALTLIVRSTYYDTPLKKAFVIGKMRKGERWLDVAGAICHPKHV